ncbi:PREDICTED: uncharacterized protein LOC109219834 [Nicotiana attenuata]|uniref:uncharacterized protein LOC109219834 n=1 Tax=Nicotiana attenuata TaxID=49451 RepID=UPI000904EBC2|nr:PREDICTED: uncharacterized protein LOC109219834 [Nicotiana attenuata]
MGASISNRSLYRRLVGKLNFLQHTRPDISFSVQHLSQFLHHPQVPHMLAALHVLRYLMNDPAQGILLSNSANMSLMGFSDSNWGSCTISRKSVSGYYITLGGNPVSWKSKKQPTISLSSAEGFAIANPDLCYAGNCEEHLAFASWELRLQRRICDSTLKQG